MRHLFRRSRGITRLLQTGGRQLQKSTLAKRVRALTALGVVAVIMGVVGCGSGGNSEAGVQAINGQGIESGFKRLTNSDLGLTHIAVIPPTAASGQNEQYFWVTGETGAEILPQGVEARGQFRKSLSDSVAGRSNRINGPLYFTMYDPSQNINPGSPLFGNPAWSFQLQVLEPRLMVSVYNNLTPSITFLGVLPYVNGFSGNLELLGASPYIVHEVSYALALIKP